LLSKHSLNLVFFMSDDINEILKWSYRAINIAPLGIMAIISIVALVKQRFWIPVFIHLLAYGGAIVTFLVIMIIPRDQPYSIIELLGAGASSFISRCNIWSLHHVGGAIVYQ
jgi:hypothetical protein